MAGRPPLVVLIMIAISFAPALGPARADNALGESAVIVAMVDTGVDVQHQEFDYQGSSSTTDQVVAWWDFTPERKPMDRTDPFALGSPLWDLDIADPYDNNGHGTATASLSVGRNLVSGCGSNSPKLSFAPGALLAVAKVGEGGGTISGSLAKAIRWSTDVVHADVISMSIGAIVSEPNLGDDTFAAIQHAKDVGVTVVVAAGNGAANFGLIPIPSETTPFGSSPAAISVGGGSVNGNTLTSVTGNDDPDVASWSDGVCLALRDTNAGYGTGGGTSFAAPLVAGMAANAIQLALDNGHATNPEQVKSLLQHCATDTIAPYTREGWGFLLSSEVTDCVHPHAIAGDIATYAPFGGTPVNPNEVYGSTVAASLRLAASTPLVATTTLIRTPAPTTTAPGELGVSTPVVMEAEGHAVRLDAGQTVHFTIRYDSPTSVTTGQVNVPDFDVGIWPAADFVLGVLSPTNKLANSGRVGGLAEDISYTAAATGDYVLVVYGWAVAPGSVLYHVDSHGTTVTFAGQGIWAGQTLL